MEGSVYGLMIIDCIVVFAKLLAWRLLRLVERLSGWVD